MSSTDDITVTLRHYWAISVMARMDVMIRDHPDQLAEAWKLLVPDIPVEEMWDLEFEDFLKVILERIEVVNEGLKLANAKVLGNKPTTFGDWLIKGGND